MREFVQICFKMRVFGVLFDNDVFPGLQLVCLSESLVRIISGGHGQICVEGGGVNSKITASMPSPRYLHQAGLCRQEQTVNKVFVGRLEWVSIF